MFSFLATLLSPRGQTLWKILIVGELLHRVYMMFFLWGPMNTIYSDMSRHWDNAAHFLKPGAMGASNPFFYQFWLWGFRQLTHDNRIAMNIMAISLSWAALLSWYLVARTVVKEKRTALMYTALFGLIPTHALMYMYFMPETVLMPLTGIALALTLRALKRPSAIRFLGSVFFWVCAILTKSVALPVAFVSSAYALWQQRRRRLLLLIPALAITAAGFGIAGQRAYTHFGRYTPLGDGTLVSIYFVSGKRDYQVAWMNKKVSTGTFIFSSPSFYISPFHPIKWQSSRAGLVRFTLDPGLHGKDVEKTFMEQLRQNKDKLPQLIYENLIFLSFGHHWPLSGLDNWNGKICLHERWIWFPIFLASTILSLLWLRRKRAFFPAITLFATIALYGSQITVMEGRYRKFIEPFTVLAVMASVERIRLARKGNPRPLKRAKA